MPERRVQEELRQALVSETAEVEDLHLRWAALYRDRLETGCRYRRAEQALHDEHADVDPLKLFKYAERCEREFDWFLRGGD